MSIELDQETLLDLVHYEPNTGVFTWLSREGYDKYIPAWNAKYAGKKISSVNGHGYIQVSIKLEGVARKYEVHRLVWLYMYGELPKQQIDHINRIRTDNRLCNLRLASSLLNNHNSGLSRRNTSGVKGISWHKPASKWVSQISWQGKNIYLGIFANLEDAKIAYKKASLKYAKEFSVHS